MIIRPAARASLLVPQPLARLPGVSGSTEADMSHPLTQDDAASRRLVVLVNGLPAAGKTTLARALSRRLSLPLLSKDVIKEAHADIFGTRPPDGRPQRVWNSHRARRGQRDPFRAGRKGHRDPADARAGGPELLARAHAHRGLRGEAALVPRGRLRELYRLARWLGPLPGAAARGAIRVAPLSVADAEDLYVMRVALETIAIRTTVPQLNRTAAARRASILAATRRTAHSSWRGDGRPSGGRTRPARRPSPGR